MKDTDEYARHIAELVVKDRLLNEDDFVLILAKAYLKLLANHTACTSRDTYWKERVGELYGALELMYEQYCPEPFTHKYMTAGENAEEMLAKYREYRTSPITNKDNLK